MLRILTTLTYSFAERVLVLLCAKGEYLRVRQTSIYGGDGVALPWLTYFHRKREKRQLSFSIKQHVNLPSLYQSSATHYLEYPAHPLQTTFPRFAKIYLLFLCSFSSGSLFMPCNTFLLFIHVAHGVGGGSATRARGALCTRGIVLFVAMLYG